MKKNKTRYICDFEGCRHRNEENVCCLFNQENCVYYRTLQALNGYKENAKWCDDCKKIAELEAQIEKLIDFVLSKTECCDVCPITDICINSEGTCLYAGILAKGEEEVTREWLMQKITKEIKEK